MTQEQYERAIDEIVLRNSDAENFSDLVRRIGQPYPTCITDSIARLRGSGQLDAETAQRLSTNRANAYELPKSGLPIPHPQDYDWRFSTETVQRLTADPDVAAAQEIMLLGAPSIAMALLGDGRHRGLCAVDASAATINAIQTQARAVRNRNAKVLQRDIMCCGVLDFAADAVVMDPPWYNTHVRHFLWFAARHAVLGAAVLLAFPGRLTRPTIDADRFDCIEFAKACGLSVASFREKFLTYDSPPFETQSLQSIGLRVRNWRTGDLITFRKEFDGNCKRPPLQVTDPWRALHYEGVRFRVKMVGSNVPFNPVLLPLKAPEAPDRALDPFSAGTLATVSRRDPSHTLMTVWTSGNEAFYCENPKGFVAILESVSSGGDAMERCAEFLGRDLLLYEREYVLTAIKQIEGIVNRERTLWRGSDRGEL